MTRVARAAAIAIACASVACRSSGAGDTASDAGCVIPSMLDLYPDVGIPKPFEPGPAAPSCVASAHDVVIVLGCPSNDDGTPSSCQTSRADIAIGLAHAGYGSRFITSGAAVHNAFVEADALKSLLVARGVASDDVTVENRAQHTDENLYFATKIMQARSWMTALVVSDTPSHLVLTATCDSNCCVDLGRLTVFDFPFDGGTVKAGHYALYPLGTEVSAAECAHIEEPSKLMCIALAGRLACKDAFKLPP